MTDSNDAPQFIGLPDSTTVNESVGTAQVIYSLSKTDQDHGDAAQYHLIGVVPTSTLFNCTTTGMCLTTSISPVNVGQFLGQPGKNWNRNYFFTKLYSCELHACMV